MAKGSQHKFLLLSLTLLLALALRWPLVESNSKYFFHEDDAHHFNRTVEMAQKRDLNPHYFNKPALHFYLRMPVIYASVAWARFHGELSSTREVRTKDPFGLAGYAFTASHPTILTWNRSFSVALSLLIVGLTFFLSLQLGLALLPALMAALLVALSPEMVLNSHLIGVDIPMALFCLASSAVGVWAASTKYSRKRLLLCGLLAGLAGASKYNAAPIALVPIMLAWQRDRSWKGFGIAALSPVFGFLIGAPYSLISLPQFWQGLSYELWHYSVAGHAGHAAEPGVEQALFYLTWLSTNGIGVVATLLAAFGLLSCMRTNSAATKIFLIFPVAYAVLMISQKTNFTRNMVAIVPYAAILAAVGLRYMTHRFSNPVIQRTTIFLVALYACGLAAIASTSIVMLATQQAESREQLGAWLTSTRNPDSDVAISGPLQISPALIRLPGVEIFDPSKRTLAVLVQQGFEYIVVPSADSADLSLSLTSELVLAGAPLNKHAPQNPALTILKTNLAARLAAMQQAPAEMQFETVKEALSPRCGETNEEHCWLNNISTSIALPAGTTRVSLEMMSPWAGQELRVVSKEGATLGAISFPTAGKWRTFTFSLSTPAPAQGSAATLVVAQLHSPLERKLNLDSRRIGVAIRKILDK